MQDFFTCLDYVYKDLGKGMYSTSDSDSFDVPGDDIKWYFQHLPTGTKY